LRLSDLSDSASDAVRSAGVVLADMATPSLRLGVTGLSRAGKTVFITSLVQTLIDSSAAPGLPVGHLPRFRAFLEPQPDDDIPRFAYEQNLAMLQDEPVGWPESTRHISQLRLTLEWESANWIRHVTGLPRRLHIDIVDYPGEWLLDLGLLDQDYQAWSQLMIDDAVHRQQDADLTAWLTFARSIKPDNAADERIVMEGADLFTRYLHSVKKTDRFARMISPGRFLLPGELDGSPLLTFFPLAIDADQPIRPGTLAALLARRFESYKSQVVKPFFERHFKSLDRQIVLVDALGALNGGAEAIDELETALHGALNAFRPGRQSWLASLLGRRIDRVMFAATKADLIHTSNHLRLKMIMQVLLSRAVKRVQNAGAEFEVVALASLRSTEDVNYRTGSDRIPCIRGRPQAGEKSGHKVFNGQEMAAIFPGDLPDDVHDIFDTDMFQAGSLQFVRFQPPSPEKTHRAHPAVWPHTGLDQVVRYLIGDRLT